MRQALSFGFLFALTAALPLAAIGQTDIELIRKTLTDQVEAWNRGDIQGYMEGYWHSDSTVFISDGSLTHGYRNVLARYKKSYDTPVKMGRLEFSEIAIRKISESVAVATGIWRLLRAQDKPWGRFTLIVEKKPEGWKITQDHTSSSTD